MKTMDPRKALALGALLIVTLAAGCASGWSNGRDTVDGGGRGGGGFGNSYPNLDGSAGSFPHNNVYGSFIPHDAGYGERKSG